MTIGPIPIGYEPLLIGKVKHGDLYWSRAEKKWKPCRTRIGGDACVYAQGTMIRPKGDYLGPLVWDAEIKGAKVDKIWIDELGQPGIAPVNKDKPQVEFDAW